MHWTDRLRESQSQVDRSITIMSRVATMMGVLVTLITVVFIIGSIWGVFEFRNWRSRMDSALKQVEGAKEEIKKVEMEVKSDLATIRELMKEAIDTVGRIRTMTMPSYKPIPIAPLDYKGWNNAGVAYGEKGNYPSAVSALQKSIDLAPDKDKHVPMINMGIVLHDSHDFAGSVRALQKAIELKPDSYNALDAMGSSFFLWGKHREALNAFNESIKINPKSARSYYNRGRTYLKLGERQKAMEDLIKAIELEDAFKKVARDDEDYKDLKTDARFKELTK